MFEWNAHSVMGMTNKFCVILMLACFLMPTLSGLVDAKHHKPISEESLVTVHQTTGSSFSSEMFLNGSSEIPLSNTMWTLYNLSTIDEQPVALETGYLTNVEATSEDSWHWDVELNVTAIKCTCLFALDAVNSTDLPLFSLIVYLGEIQVHDSIDSDDSFNHHRPVLLPFKNNRIVVMNDVSQVFVPVVFAPHTDIESQVRMEICPAPFGICREAFSQFTDFSQTPSEQGWDVEFTPESISLPDGFWLLKIYVLDSLLRTSESQTLTFHIDRSLPDVEIVFQSETNGVVDLESQNSTIESVFESTNVSFSSTVIEGYDGGSIELTWTVVQPDGSRHSVLESQQLSDSEIMLQPSLSGTWSVELLIRDSVGRLIRTSYEFLVVNQAPSPAIQLDGLTVSDGTLISTVSGSEWDLNCDGSTDTQNDASDIMCSWYINDQIYVTGKSSLNHSDFSSPGAYDVRLVVSDDDDETSSLAFTLRIEEAAGASSRITTSNMLFSLVALGALVGLIFFVRRTMSQSAANSIPKWNRIEPSKDDSHDAKL